MANITREEREARKAAENVSSRAKEERLPNQGSLRTLQNQSVSGQKWEVMIYADQNDKGDVDLQVNGFNIRIRRGEKVIIDEAFVEVLRNAVIETTQWNPETNTRTPTQRMVYPFQATPVAA
mgnify:CR=1 FL=1